MNSLEKKVYTIGGVKVTLDKSMGSEGGFTIENYPINATITSNPASFVLTLIEDALKKRNLCMYHDMENLGQISLLAEQPMPGYERTVKFADIEEVVSKLQNEIKTPKALAVKKQIFEKEWHIQQEIDAKRSTKNATAYIIAEYRREAQRHVDVAIQFFADKGQPLSAEDQEGLLNAFVAAQHSGKAEIRIR